MSTVEGAILRFTDWHLPWTFTEFVSESLGPEDWAQFRTIWQDAVRPDHWVAPTIGECVDRAVRALSRKYPHLKRDALEAVAHAAAYEWR